MRKNLVYIISGLIILLVAVYFIYHYYFNIYEVSVEYSPKELFADNDSKVEINVVPLNAFGYRAPLRNVYVDFIIENEDLIDIIKKDSTEGILIIKAKDVPGNVIINVKSKWAFLPTEIQIPIQPNLL